MLNLFADLLERDPQKRAINKALRAWKKRNFQFPPINYERFRSGSFDEENPQYCISNMRIHKFTLETVETEHGPATAITNDEGIPVQDSVLIFLSYSPEKKNNGWETGEMVKVTRDGKIEGRSIEVSITFINGEQPSMWISSNDESGGGGSRFEGEDFTFEEVLRRFPEFTSYLPSKGKIDIEATARGLSSLVNDIPLPFVLKQ